MGTACSIEALPLSLQYLRSAAGCLDLPGPKGILKGRQTWNEKKDLERQEWKGKRTRPLSNGI